MIKIVKQCQNCGEMRLLSMIKKHICRKKAGPLAPNIICQDRRTDGLTILRSAKSNDLFNIFLQIFITKRETLII